MKPVMKTAGSMVIGAGYFKLLHSFLFAQKGFLAANSRFMFMTFPIPNSVIVMAILIIMSMAYLWHLDVNK